MAGTFERKSIFFILLIVAIIAMVTVRLVFSLRSDSVGEQLKDDQVVKVLFVLHDKDNSSLATDVFVYYPRTRKGALFDILGNTGAIYESLGRVDRIDTIYKEKGVDVYRQEIEKLTDLAIPFSIEISIDDFGRLTDLLGGLKVFVPQPVDVVDSSGKRWLLPSGAVNLDGDKIQTYLEYSTDMDEDGEQEERRQNAIVAFLSSIYENRSVILDKKNFPRFSSKMKANMETKGFYELFDLFSNVQSESLSVQTVVGSPRMVDGQMLLFPYQDGQLMKDVVRQKIRMLINEDESMNRRVYIVEVLNGTVKQGLARNASILLQNAGYNILQVGNADRGDYEHTVIINHIGNPVAAEALGDFITCYNIIDEALPADDETVANVDFTLILGKDWDGRYVRGGFGKEDSEGIEG